MTAAIAFAKTQYESAKAYVLSPEFQAGVDKVASFASTHKYKLFFALSVALACAMPGTLKFKYVVETMVSGAVIQAGLLLLSKTVSDALQITSDKACFLFGAIVLGLQYLNYEAVPIIPAFFIGMQTMSAAYQYCFSNESVETV